MLCSTPGCTEEATSGHRCRKHERERNRRHRSEHKSIYNTRKWKFTRRRVLFERPLCERCGGIATDVHHREGYDDPYNLDGLEPLCHSCHSKVTRAEQLGRADDASLVSHPIPGQTPTALHSEYSPIHHFHRAEQLAGCLR